MLLFSLGRTADELQVQGVDLQGTIKRYSPGPGCVNKFCSVVPRPETGGGADVKWDPPFGGVLYNQRIVHSPPVPSGLFSTL